MTNDSNGSTPKVASFDDELFDRILRSVDVGETIHTLGNGEANQIVAIDRDGILVSTMRSKERGSGAQRVPAWMVTRAWEHLRRHGGLSREALTEGLGVNRSSFVCALLARFPEIEVAKRKPIQLRLRQKPI
jgi:hypothetical protein